MIYSSPRDIPLRRFVELFRFLDDSYKVGIVWNSLIVASEPSGGLMGATRVPYLLYLPIISVNINHELNWKRQ